MSAELIQEILNEYGTAITSQLEVFFDSVPKLLGVELSEQSLAAITKLRDYSLRPSKRIRGSLACFAYDFAAKTQQGEPGIQCGVAIELIQNYLLIIDDVMDKSDLRRGQPTLHRVYAREHDEHLANMLAIDIGVVAQHLANTVLLTTTEDSDRVRQALTLLHRNINITCFGQLDDLSQYIGQAVSEADIMRKYTFKSSYYTFINPLQIGSVLGGKGEAMTLKELEMFGIAAGVAFQLHDDVLGVFGNPKKTGKSNLDDIQEGKYTLMLHHALEHANTADKRILQQLVGNPKLRPKQLQAVQNILNQSGSKQYVEQKALAYASQAKEVIAASTFWDVTSKRILEALVDYSLTREK